MKSKYTIRATISQFAMVETHNMSINRVKPLVEEAKFSNGLPAVQYKRGFSTKRDANIYLERFNKQLAYVSGRLGRWITPTAYIVEVK